MLEHGFAYDADGTALHGKVFFNALTAGGLEAAYRAEGYNHFTIRELLHPNEQTARLCGMIYLPPFALFGSRTAIDEKERAVEMVEHVRRNYPQIKTLARAYDVNHLYLLNNAGVDIALRELFDASLEVGKQALQAVGMHPFKVEKTSRAFCRHDLAGLDSLYELWDENTEMSSNKAYLARAREHGATLKELMEADRLQLHDRSERGWKPPKGYAEKSATDYDHRNR